MVECKRIESARARHLPLVSDLPEGGGIVSVVSLLVRWRLRDEADFAGAGAQQDGHCPHSSPIGHAVVAAHQHGGFWRATQNRRSPCFDRGRIEEFILLRAVVE